MHLYYYESKTVSPKTQIIHTKPDVYSLSTYGKASMATVAAVVGMEVAVEAVGFTIIEACSRVPRQRIKCQPTLTMDIESSDIIRLIEQFLREQQLPRTLKCLQVQILTLSIDSVSTGKNIRRKPE